MKLLDFPGKGAQKMAADAVQSKLKDMIEENIYQTDTPDLPQFRFSGPQLVFMWDKMKDPQEWVDELLMRNGPDMKTVYYAAETEKAYLPLEVVSSNPRHFSHLLFEENGFMPSIQHSQKDELAAIKMLPLGGKVVSCGMAAMIALDQHYSNQYAFTRKKIKVFTSGLRRDTDSVMAWAYFTRLPSVSKYDPHTRTYKLPSDCAYEKLCEFTTMHGTRWEIERTNYGHRVG